MRPCRWPSSLTAALLLAERPAIERALSRAGVNEADLDDLVQDVVLRVLRAIEEGAFELPTDLARWRPVVRSYLSTVAWRMGRAWCQRRSRELVLEEAREHAYDIWSWLEARSELRALEVPEDVRPLLQALAEGSDLAPVARELGLSVGTAHGKARRFRAGLMRRKQGVTL